RKNMTSPYESLQKISRIADTTQELLVIKQEDHMGEIVYLLLIRLNQVELDAMAENYQKLGYEVTVFSNDEVLTQTSQDFTDAYLAGSSERDHVYRSAQRHQYYASRTDTGISGLTCIVGYNLEALRSRGAVFVWMSFLFAGCLALLILLIRYASKMVSRPVIQLQKLVDHQNNQIRELFITTMIKGEVTEKKIQDTLKKMNLTEYPHYRMIGVICKSSLTGKSMEEIKRTELHAAIINAQPSKVWEQFFVMPVLYRNVMLFLVGEENEIDLDRKTAMLYKEIKDEIAETYGYTIAAGVSRSFAELMQLNHAYEECLETLHNKQNQDLTYSSLVLYDDYSLDDHILNTYDIVIENELVNAISGANEEEANHLLDLILERMERRKVTGIERNFYVVRLLTAIIAILDQASIPLGEVFGSEQYNIIVQTSQIYDKNKLRHHIKQEMIHPIAEAITNKNQSGGSEIAKQVIRMIKESKGNITLNECAESLNYHPNYIWKVLKKETGQNFTDLAGNEKLELAKFMLLTTDYAIAEISDKLQYTNVQSFIRFFKSHTETTPASFRKAHKH
ncbi:MAG: helix-turn-helix transcriptional regulator, partial [Hungatella sp.]